MKYDAYKIRRINIDQESLFFQEQDDRSNDEWEKTRREDEAWLSQFHGEDVSQMKVSAIDLQKARMMMNQQTKSERHLIAQNHEEYEELELDLVLEREFPPLDDENETEAGIDVAMSDVEFYDGNGSRP